MHTPWHTTDSDLHTHLTDSLAASKREKALTRGMQNTWLHDHAAALLVVNELNLDLALARALHLVGRRIGRVALGLRRVLRSRAAEIRETQGEHLQRVVAGRRPPPL